MDSDVYEWLKSNELEDLLECFIRHKLFTFRRLRRLNEQLIAELIPEIGLRADFLVCWTDFKAATEATEYRVVNFSEADVRRIYMEIKHQESTDADSGCGASTLSCASSTDVINNHISQPCCSRQTQKEDSELRHYQDPDNDQKSLDLNCESSDSISDPASPDPPAPKKSKISLSHCNTMPNSSSQPRESKKHKHLICWQALEQLSALDLHKLLIGDLKSRAALHSYQTNGGFTSDTERSIITDVIVRCMLNINNSPSLEEYEKVTEKLCELFPHESPDIYFEKPNGTSKNPTGRLPNKVRNIKYALLKRAKSSIQLLPVLYHEPSTTKQHKISKLTKPVRLHGSSDENDPAVLKAVTYLTNQITSSWPEIKKNWSITHPLRLKSFQVTHVPAPGTSQESYRKDSNVEDQLLNDYFKKWTILSASNGHLLISQDFDELYPDNKDMLLSQWESSKYFIVKLANSEVSKTDMSTVQLLEDIENTAKDKQDALILSLLPGLCVNKRGRVKRSIGSCAIPEARKPFILHVTIPGDENREIMNYRQSILNRGLQCQPFVVLIGPTLREISASYVQVHTERYKLKNPVAAVDFCFKAFFSLHAAYPTDSYSVWLFLQRFFYGMILEEDVSIPRVTSTISSLKGLQSKCLEQKSAKF